MGMQVTSHLVGSNLAAATQYELTQGKRLPLPREQKPAEKDMPTPVEDNSSLSDNEIQKTTSDLEHISIAFNRRLKFVLDQESREILIKVIDRETDKVIKVLPPEELQRLHSRIKETMGFLFDRMV
jgi:flagellar protein FlaG